MTAPGIAELSHGGRIRAIVAGSTGNLIEWFDFYIYAFTAIYFAAAFFPSGDRTAQLLNVAGIYAAGFLVRPLGGWYFGRFSDRRGRKAGMVVSIMMMGLASLAIAVMPTHAAIGALAPALLLLARLAQGFSTGGQYGAAATYLSEVATAKNRGFYASFLFVTLIGGQLMALIVVLLLQTFLSETDLRQWGWRIPFVIGAALAATLLLFRDYMPETVSAERRNPNAGSIKGLLRYPKSLAIVTCVASGGGLCIYTFTTYMQKFLVNTAGMAIETANTVVTFAIIVFMLAQPAVGALSDRIGRRACLIIFGVLMTLCVVPLLSTLAHTASPVQSFLLLATALVILTFYTAISGLFKAELFPPSVRALGVGVAHNVAQAIFGGTAEFFALLFKKAGHEQWFYWYVAAVCAVTLITAVLMRETRHTDMMAAEIDP